jgi:hypothetical protein
MTFQLFRQVNHLHIKSKKIEHEFGIGTISDSFMQHWVLFLKIYHKLHQIRQSFCTNRRNGANWSIMCPSFPHICNSKLDYSNVLSKRSPLETTYRLHGYRVAWRLIGFSLREYHTNAQQSTMTTNLLPSVMLGIACCH